MTDPRPANEPRFFFEIDGMELDAADFNARERISAPFEVDVTLVSEDEVAFEDAVGKPGLLTIHARDEDRFFNGIVNQFIQTGQSGRFFLYQARLVPQLWTLSLKQNCRIFQNKSVPEIVQQVLQDAGITGDLFSFRLQGTYEPRDYCVQYRETDLNFISRLLEEEGIFYFFEHSEQKHLLILGDGTVNYQPIAGNPDVVFNPGGMVEEEESVHRFLLSRVMCSGKYTIRDFDFAKPSLDLTSEKSDSENTAFEVYDYPAEYFTQEAGKKRAQIRLEEAVAFKDRAEGDSDCARFSPGYTFDLTDHPLADFNRTYLFYELIHNGEQPQALQERSTSGAEATYSNLFYAIAAQVTYRPERNTPKPVVEGVQTAIVTGPAGEEIYVDAHGRVKVQFHWDRLGKKDEKSSCWIRTSQNWAGEGWGAMFIPRIGHEVIVDFIEGDPDRPIITGRVYHGTNTPPYSLPAERTKSTIKSNSSKGGGGSNEIRFEDKKGSEQVYIHAQKDMSEVVENNMSTSVGGNRTISVSGTHTETITKDTKITISQGHFNHDVKTGSATLHVKGDVKQDYDATQKTTVANQIEIKSKGSHIHLTAATEIHLKVGKSELLLKSDGSIKLKGVDLAIDGATVNIHGGTVTSKADTLNETKGSIVLVEGAATATIKGGMIMLNP